MAACVAVAAEEELTVDAIHTDRLTLRAFREDDAQDLLGYLHQPGSSCFLLMKLDDLPAARAAAIKRSSEPDTYALEHHPSGRVIGEVFGHFEPPDTFSIAWMIHPDFAGQGLAHEAAKAIVDHLFQQRDVRRVYAYVETDNLPSQRLCARLGMRQEGLFKEFISFENDAAGKPIYVDTMQFALLKKEWAAA